MRCDGVHLRKPQERVQMVELHSCPQVLVVTLAAGCRLLMNSSSAFRALGSGATWIVAGHCTHHLRVPKIVRERFRAGFLVHVPTG